MLAMERADLLGFSFVKALVLRDTNSRSRPLRSAVEMRLPVIVKIEPL